MYKDRATVSSTCEQTIMALRDAILDFRFFPGERLKERDLCNLLGVSRTSVRESLRHLQAEGLIDIEPNRGPIVASVSKNQLIQIYESRSIMDSQVVGAFVCRATDEEIRWLKKNTEEVIESIGLDGGVPHVVVKLVDNYYETLYWGSRNDFLSGFSRSLRARVRYIRGMSPVCYSRDWARKSRDSYLKVIESVEERDSEAAMGAVRVRIENARGIALSILAEYSEHSLSRVGRLPAHAYG